MGVSKSRTEGSRHHELGRDELANWRITMLRVLMRASGFGMVSVALVLWLTHAYPGGLNRTTLLAWVGPALLVGSVYAHKAPRAFSIAFCTAATALLFDWIHVTGWPPNVVVVNIFTIVIAGLLLGRRASYLVVAATCAAFVANGLAVRHGMVRPDFPPELDPSRLANWIRLGSTYACLTATAACALGRIGSLLARAESDLTTSVNQLEERLALLDATKARRSKTGEALRNAQKLHTIAQLGRGFAQLFNNVLTTIGTALEEARQAKSAEAFSTTIAMIRDAVAAAATRSRDLLSVSRPHHLTAADCDLKRILLELTVILKARLRCNVQLELDLQDAGHVMVTRQWLDQVLTNLLLNAEQAMSDGGSIVIRTRLLSLETPRHGSCQILQPGWYASIRVSDDGPGMSEEVAERAFEPFFTTRDAEKHVGLGLTVVFEMVSQAGGTIEIERSERGASLVVYLPCRQSLLDQYPSSPSSAPDPTEDSSRPPPWKPAVLDVLCRIGAWCTLVTAVAAELYRLVVGSSDTTHLIIGIPLAMVFVFTGWYWKWSFASRLTCVVGSALVACYLFWALVGFMAPAPIALATLAILLLWLLHSPLAALIALAITTAALAATGQLYAVGILVGSARAASLARAENWLRVAVNVSSADFLVATVLLYVVRAAQQRVGALTRVQRDFERAERETEIEAHALGQLEAMAARSNRIESMGRVTGMIAHDLNNSLQSLGGWAEVLLNEPADPGKMSTRQILEEMAEAAHYTEALVSSLAFDESRNSSETTLDVGGATLRAKSLLKALLGKRQTLDIEIDGEGWVRFDEPSLRRILMNLIANARDAMGPEGHCRVRVKQRGECVELSVEDDGCGMSESTKLRIFDAFFTTKGAAGNGLGLHSVAATVHASGGQIEVWSEPGKGARFLCRLQRASTPTETHLQAKPTPRPHLTGRILLADGDTLVRGALRMSLTRAGFEVAEATTGTDALRILSSTQHFAALCTDLWLAGRSCQAVVRAFVTRFPERPAVLMAGHELDAIAAAMLDLKGVRLLHKPFAGSQLVDVLERSIAADSMPIRSLSARCDFATNASKR